MATTSAAADFEVALTGLTPDLTWEVQAATTSVFPLVATREIEVDAEAETTTTDEAAYEITLPAGAGLGLVACTAVQDAVVTLHGDEGAELARYEVDVDAKPTPTPTPEPTPTPTPNPVPEGAEGPLFQVEGRTARYVVCVDGVADGENDGVYNPYAPASARADYFTGGEKTGALPTAVPLTGGSVVYSVEAVDDWAFFTFDPLDNTLAVSELGAHDTIGLDGTRLYEVSVTAEDPDDLSASSDTLAVSVGVDRDNASQARNGQCDSDTPRRPYKMTIDVVPSNGDCDDDSGDGDDDNGCTITWSPPNDGNSPIVNYQVQLRDSPQGTWRPACDTTVDNACQLGAAARTHMYLINDGQTYQFRVRALNRVGNAFGHGDWSDPVPESSP